MCNSHNYSWLLLSIFFLNLQGESTIQIITSVVFDVHEKWLSEEEVGARKILTVDSLALLEQEIPTLDADTLIIFDRDDTLLQGIDMIESAHRKAFIEQWKQIYMTEKTAVEKNEFYGVMRAVKPTLIEPSAPALIKKFQDAGAQVIILTRGCHGQGITGRNVADLCIDSFKAVGIDLSQSFAPFSGLMLNSSTHNGYSPLFKSGIIFSNGCDKGNSVEAFFQAIGWQPKRIIFVDDKRHYVQEVCDAAQRLKISFLGLVYTGAKKLTPPDITLHCFKMCYLLGRDLGL